MEHRAQDQQDFHCVGWQGYSQTCKRTWCRRQRQLRASLVAFAPPVALYAYRLARSLRLPDGCEVHPFLGFKEGQRPRSSQEACYEEWDVGCCEAREDNFTGSCLQLPLWMWCTLSGLKGMPKHRCPHWKRRVYVNPQRLRPPFAPAFSLRGWPWQQPSY